MKFCNEYQFDEKGIYETINTWYKHRFTEPKAFGLYAILSLLMTVAMLLLGFKEISLFAICFSVLLSLLTVSITIAISGKAAAQKSAKAQTERLKMLHQDKTSPTSIILNDTEIHYSSPSTHKTVQYNDIAKVIQSKHFIILLLKGDMTLPLKKDGFTKGTMDECLAFLDEVIKKY